MTPAESLQLLALPTTTTDRWLEQLAEPQRHYHTLEHVTAMLAHVDKVSSEWNQPNAIAPLHQREFVAAIWLHDIVYDPRSSDNEERSAEQALHDLAGSGLHADTVAALIMATKRHDAATELEKALIDLDLGILSAAPAAYDRYARQIRMEYDFVPYDTYRAARIKILDGFDRRVIFRTASFTPLEAQAHENLRREMQHLRS
ncbi:hypothetical protein [Sphingomonas jatrophae]|uniref:Predicted metal-dependent phosphohydrolase, HD superfamily n=1 Tax=Sphingomonas jatrophae TaxID=1166337 RepID=A0A1I6JX97_9SPHN|nr:hypothetical protein [Sphingomonas jatrophae]SFR83604.1 Predicted metal-dependent phosphohydrolase, HD superfamily [Sphingomonas jatrophae]